MNTAVNELVRSLIHKDSLGQCSINELEKLVAQYPYFGPAQFLLAQKLKAENSPKYPKQSQRAILYFQDHLWFDFLSREEDLSAMPVSTSNEKSIAPPVMPITPGQEKHEKHEEDILPATPLTTEPIIQNLAQPVEEIALTPDFAEYQTSEPEPVHEIIAAPPPSTEPAEVIQEETNDLPMNTEEQPTRAAEEQAPAPDLPFESGKETPLHEMAEPGPVQETALPPLRIVPLDKAAALTFEPYHTVDYFASQGILLKEEERPKDKFSQQLKSFTEWLKTMKRLPEAGKTNPSATAIDQKVTVMAEHSIADREVVTEAMAEVWEKQGNHQKALEIYRKLSLLDPPKSAYFAAKIEHLKNQ